jgi:CTD kinase subunit alpha
MAALRRAQDIDQWRPEDSSTRDSERSRERSRERNIEARTSSPVPRAARDSSRHRAPDTHIRSSARHVRGRSRERSLSRERARRRSRSTSGEDRYRASKREVSADRVSHSHRHHHHHRDTTPSSKRHHPRSPSPRGSAKRVKRQRSRSSIRSTSRSRRAYSPGRPPSRAYSPRPARSDRDRPPRRPTPDTYFPTASNRRRSPSVDSHYRPVAHRSRKRSVSLERRSRREISPRRTSPRRTDRRPISPFDDRRERSYKSYNNRDRARSRSRASRRARSPSRPPRRRSPDSVRRDSPPPRRSRSPRSSLRRRPSRSPSFTSRPRQRLDKGADSGKPALADRITSRRGSPAPGSGYNSDASKSREDQGNMRGAYHYQGRGGFQQSPPYPAQNQYSPQNQSPYHGGRGGWNNQPYPNQGSVLVPLAFGHSHADIIRSPMQGYTPNQSPYHQNQSPGYYPNQPYPQPGFQNSPHRGGHGSYRGNNFNGPDRRMSGPGANPPFGGPGGRGRGTAPTQFSNLSWTPASGTRGGRPATEAPRPQPAVASQAPADSASVDADDNPFRPSKDLRVEDEGPKEEKRPVKPPTAPKSGFGFSLKTKNPVPPASKAKPGLEESERPEPVPKESPLAPKAKVVAPAREASPRRPEPRSDRDRDFRDRGYDSGRERDNRERDRRYDNYYDRKPAYRDVRDPRDRDARDVRDPREPPYYRGKERDFREPRDRDLRDPRDIRDLRDVRERDPRDMRSPRDPRDIRDRREPYPPRRPDDRRFDPRPDPRSDPRPARRTPPPQVPKTRIVTRKRMKPRPTLVPEHAASESVYYRKPGNESVVGSGTYGKVFKGVHVYTKDMVALKKIRMEGERDGVSTSNKR